MKTGNVSVSKVVTKMKHKGKRREKREVKWVIPPIAKEYDFLRDFS
jgi:hypothetical protein